MVFVEDIKEDLEKSLSEYRFQHSLRVAEVARDLAKCYGYDEEIAYLTGLVHDIAKEYSEEENRNVLKNHCNVVKEVDITNARLAHSVIGALVLKEKYGLNEDICHAVSCHTYGDIPMNLLDKILFVADKIEPLKKYDGIEEERRLAFINLDQALILCMENHHKKLLKQGKKLYPKSIEVLEYLRKK